MAQMQVHLVRITTDDKEHQLWVVAAPREEALDKVLNAIPEGWTAALLSNRLKPFEVEALNIKPGDVRELSRRSPDPKTH
jgi:hypothetical protein